VYVKKIYPKFTSQQLRYVKAVFSAYYTVHIHDRMQSAKSHCEVRA